MKTKRVRPALVESKDKITLNSIVNDPTFGLGIIIEKHGEECFYNTHSSGGSITTPWERNLGDRLKHYELILISLEDEKIEVGDLISDSIFIINASSKIVESQGLINRREWKRIIARQSQISPEYISKFIEQYNKDCVEDLEIEMEDKIAIDGHTVIGIESKLTNGFVTIVEKEAVLYTENDMRNAFEAGHKLGWSGYPNTDNWTQPKFEEWFKENKKK